jgi:hypothetical protein
MLVGKPHLVPVVTRTKAHHRSLNPERPLLRCVRFEPKTPALSVASLPTQLHTTSDKVLDAIFFLIHPRGTFSPGWETFNPDL